MAQKMAHLAVTQNHSRRRVRTPKEKKREQIPRVCYRTIRIVPNCARERSKTSCIATSSENADNP